MDTRILSPAIAFAIVICILLSVSVSAQGIAVADRATFLDGRTRAKGDTLHVDTAVVTINGFRKYKEENGKVTKLIVKGTTQDGESGEWNITYLVRPAYVAAFKVGEESLLGILPTKDGKVFIEEVITSEGNSKEDLYKRAKRWVADAYRSAPDVVKLDDANDGALIVKGYFKTFWQATFMTGLDVKVYHTLHIDVKDGKFRYRISELTASGYNPSTRYGSGGPWEYSLEYWCSGRKQNAKRYLEQSLAPEIAATIASLSKAMTTSVASDNW